MHEQKRRRRGAAEWAEIVARWEQSGGAARTFAARLGVRPATLAWWRWRLRKTAPPPDELRLVRVDVAPGVEEPSDGEVDASRWQLVTKTGALRVRGRLGGDELSIILAALMGTKAP